MLFFSQNWRFIVTHKCPKQILIVSILIHSWCRRRAFCHSGRFGARAHNRFWRSTTLFWLGFRSRLFLGSAAFFSLRLNFWFIFYNFRLNFCNFGFIFYNFRFISTSVSVGSGGSGGCSCRSSSLSGTVCSTTTIFYYVKKILYWRRAHENFDR